MTARPPSAPAGSLFRPRRPWLVLGVAVLAGAAMAAPYAGLDIRASRLPVRDQVHYGLLVAHIGTALVGLVLGPLQFVPAVRARRRVHRRIGRTYLLAGVLPSALTVIGWLVTGALGVRAVRRGDVQAHRDWMLRNYALTFLAVTARLLVPLMLLASLPFGGSPSAVTGLIPLGQVLGWVVNLAVVEVWIRRRRGRIRHDAGMPDNERVT
jgi:uncharacterized membrane protein YozB (DUF420 family)